MWVGMCVGLFFLMVRQPTRSTRTEHTLALHYSLTISPAELYAHSRHDKARTSMPNRQKHAERCGSKGIAQRRNGRSRPFARRGFDDSITRSEEHTTELQSLMRLSYAVFCLKKTTQLHSTHQH